MLSDSAPIWSRDYSEDVPLRGKCDELGRVLGALGAKRMVVGHTVQKNGITSACGGRVWRIDVGLRVTTEASRACWSSAATRYARSRAIASRHHPLLGRGPERISAGPSSLTDSSCRSMRAGSTTLGVQVAPPPEQYITCIDDDEPSSIV